jgi:replication factor A2
MPVSVHQLLHASNHDDVYKVDDVELNIIKIIGVLSNPQEHSTNFNFRVNDGSGSIECRLWIEKDANGLARISRLKNGNLVRVVGNIREYDGKIHISVFDAAPVEDWNELTYHTLDIIHTHLQNTKGPQAVR